MFSKILNDIKLYFKKYRVAIQYSGLPRTYAEDFENIYTNLIKPLNADVFIHTWNTGSRKVCEDMIQTYHPKSHFIQNLTEDDINHGFNRYVSRLKASKMVGHDIVIENSIPMLYSRHACNELRLKYERKISQKYDIIILMRTELTVERQLTRNELHTAANGLLIPRGFNGGGYNDLFAVCSPKIADTYTYLYHTLDRLVFDEYKEFNPHSTLKQLLDQAHITAERIEYPIYLRKQETWNQ
jgi:hypothetical protein